MNARPWIAIVGSELVVLALIVAGVMALARGPDGSDSDHAQTMSKVVTLNLDTVDAALAADYRYVAKHAPAFAQIPCYCGCDRTAGHRNLADCYITPSGEWDAHASGCAICGHETSTVREQLGVGEPITDVRLAIIEMYGTPPSLFSSGRSS